MTSDGLLLLSVLGSVPEVAAFSILFVVAQLGGATVGTPSEFDDDDAPPVPAIEALDDSGPNHPSPMPVTHPKDDAT